jgi:hypothetical protein
MRAMGDLVRGQHATWNQRRPAEKFSPPVKISPSWSEHLLPSAERFRRIQ